ncbi:MAG: sugar phosphate isomerase/epimerase [Thermomicrobiales bacterium]|nr:sugar phosphate isomerase/epimerase [Thermomicrobiales bacterium]
MAERLTGLTNTYHSYSLDEALSGLARAGFKSIELTSVPGWTEHVRRDAGAEEIAAVKDALNHYGLTAVSLAGHSDLVSESGVAEFRKALNIAQKLGISYVTTSSGGHDASSGGSLEEQRNHFMAHIRPLADEAAAAGITICLETHGGLLASGVIAKKLIQDIGKENIGINYDPGNAIFYGAVVPEDDIQESADYVRHMHCKDQIGGPGVWNFPTVGTGEVNFPAIFAALDKAGFSGPVSIEIEFTGEPWPALADVDKAVADSYTYVRQFVKD